MNILHPSFIRAMFENFYPHGYLTSDNIHHLLHSA